MAKKKDNDEKRGSLGFEKYYSSLYGKAWPCLKEKLHEAVKSVLPIALIVALLAFTIAPVPTDLMLSFVIGSKFWPHPHIRR